MKKTNRICTETVFNLSEKDKDTLSQVYYIIDEIANSMTGSDTLDIDDGDVIFDFKDIDTVRDILGYLKYADNLSVIIESREVKEL